MPLVRKPPASLHGPDKQPIAVVSLTSAVTDERWAAARAAVNSPDSLSALAEALAQESDLRVREALFTALARIATPQSAAVVLAYLRSEEASLRSSAIDALRTMPRAVAHILPALLADPDGDVRLLSCELVRDLPAEEATELLCRLLDQEIEKNVCAAAIEVLAEIGTPTALPVLKQCAARFADDGFIAFSIRVVVERLGTSLPPSHE